MIDADQLQFVRYELDEGVARVTITRPKALNALNDRTLTELERVFADVASDDEVGGVLVTGDGPKSFVAGADIGELAELSPVQAQAASAKGQRVFDAIAACPKPVVGAVNGFALGGGLELALACHVRFASDRARLGLPEVTLGLIPGYGGTQRLTRLCGEGRALELILSGDMIDAARAAEIGLVNRVVEADDLLTEAEAFLRRILSRGPVAVRFALDAVRGGADLPLERALERERDLFGLCFATADMREGTRAFLDKRKPEFRGE